MPLYKEKDGKFIQWMGEPINGTQYPSNIEHMWSYETLASVGLYRPQEPHTVPEGVEIISTEPKWDDDGYVRYTHTFAPLEDYPITTSTSDVNRERDSRIEAGLTFNGNLFDTDYKSVERIKSFSIIASEAIRNGAASGNLYWHHPKSLWKLSQKKKDESRLDKFEWIDLNNNLVEMDAFELIDLMGAIIQRERHHILAARKLKDMDPIPTNYQDEVFWP